MCGGYADFSASDTVYKGASSISAEIVKYSGNIMYIVTDRSD